ncbi:MAG: hypothetical protein ACR2PF_05845 [Rhizobiaceae bacterium]
MAIASGGDHWVQMRRIMPAFEGLGSNDLTQMIWSVGGAASSSGGPGRSSGHASHALAEQDAPNRTSS